MRTLFVTAPRHTVMDPMALARFIRFLAAWAWTLGVAFWAAVFMLPAPGWSWRFFAGLWGRGTLRILGIRVDIEHGERLAGPAVFIANHQSLADGALMPALLPPTVKFVAKQELARIPFWGFALSHGGGLMIDRSNPRGAVAAIREGLERMPPGWSVAVFPEGTRSPDGELGRFKKGAFHIATERRLPVVPIGFWGARDIVPKGAWFFRAATVYVTVGEPIHTDSWTSEKMSEQVAVGRRAVAACVERSRARHRAAHAPLAHPRTAVDPGE